VTYEEHGGTTVPDATFVSGGTVTLPVDPTRAGYTFDGWFTAQTGGTMYDPTFSPPDGNLVVHAQWTRDPFTVTYEEHGGTTVSDSEFVSGGTVTLPAKPTRAGYTFDGWFTAQTGGTKYGSTSSPLDGNLVVHAQWTQISANTVFTVTYEEYGGTTVPNTTFVSGGTVTLPADPTRAGYTFDGWFTEETDGTRFNSTFSPTDENVVVHAQWTQNPTPAPAVSSFAVTYEEHGGSAVPDATFVSGGTVTLPADPTRAGYTFNGWFTAQTGGTKYNASFSPSDGNVTVHAQWTQNPAPTPFSVTYEEHGGTSVPDSTFVSGGTVTLPAKPTRAGYTFDGWFTAQTGGTKYNVSFSPSDGNVTVHAQWTQNPAPTPLTVAVSATQPVLPKTGNNVESLLLAAFALMILGLFVRARRSEHSF
jgi:uncharacterized repeat protein (TIGR02543 family)/LPXTG-motif cell wall-anchored protein